MMIQITKEIIRIFVIVCVVFLVANGLYHVIGWALGH